MPLQSVSCPEPHSCMPIAHGTTARRAACAPRYQSSSLECSGEGGGHQCSPTLSAARESIAVSSGSDSGNATLQLNYHFPSLACPPMQRWTSCHPLAHRTRCAAPPCPGIQQTRLETPDGAMCWRNERPMETHSMGKLSL